MKRSIIVGAASLAVVILALWLILSGAADAQQMARAWRCTNCEPETPRDLALLKCSQGAPYDYRRNQRWWAGCLAMLPK
jgi:hypothetical protein